MEFTNELTFDTKEKRDNFIATKSSRPGFKVLKKRNITEGEPGQEVTTYYLKYKVDR